MVLQGIIDRLKGARELTIKRLYKLVLRKALGNFLAGQLGVDQLDVKLIVLEDTPSSSSSTRQGYVQLTDLEVNADALNVYLESQPFKLQKGRIGKVEVTVCYEKLLTEGFKIVLEDVELVVVKRKPEEEGDAKGRKAGGGGMAEVRRKKEEEEKKQKQEPSPSSSRSSRSSSSSSSSSSSEDASIIAEWIEQITTQLRVEVKGLKVRIVEGTSPPSVPPSVRPSLPPSFGGEGSGSRRVLVFSPSLPPSLSSFL